MALSKDIFVSSSINKESTDRRNGSMACRMNNSGPSTSILIFVGKRKRLLLTSESIREDESDKNET